MISFPDFIRLFLRNSKYFCARGKDDTKPAIIRIILFHKN